MPHELDKLHKKQNVVIRSRWILTQNPPNPLFHFFFHFGQRSARGREEPLLSIPLRYPFNRYTPRLSVVSQRLLPVPLHLFKTHRMVHSPRPHVLTMTARARSPTRTSTLAAFTNKRFSSFFSHFKQISGPYVVLVWYLRSEQCSAYFL